HARLTPNLKRVRLEAGSTLFDIRRGFPGQHLYPKQAVKAQHAREALTSLLLGLFAVLSGFIPLVTPPSDQPSSPDAPAASRPAAPLRSVTKRSWQTSPGRWRSRRRADSSSCASTPMTRLSQSLRQRRPASSLVRSPI